MSLRRLEGTADGGAVQNRHNRSPRASDGNLIANGYQEGEIAAMPSKLCRWGNSLGIRLPQYIAERTGLVAGDYLYIQLNDAGEIVIRPVKAIEVAAGYATQAAQVPQKKGSVLDRW